MTAAIHAITVTSLSPETVLNVLSGNDVNLFYSGTVSYAGSFAVLPRSSDVYFEVVDTSAIPVYSGQFSPDRTAIIENIEVSGALLVNVGIDMNVDGTLDSSEVSHQFTLIVVHLASAVFMSRRTGDGPVEPLPFVIESNEQHEAGATFEFSVGGEGFETTHPMLRTAIVDADSSPGRLIDDNPGLTISEKFNEGDDLGHTYILLYADTDSNGQFDIASDPYSLSAVFYVAKVRPLVFDIDLPLNAFGNPDPDWVTYVASLAAAFDDASNLVLRKDAQEDHRAAVTFVIGTINWYTPDPANGRSTYLSATVVNDEVYGHYLSTSHIIFVNDIAGSSPAHLDKMGNKVFIEKIEDPDFLATTIAHEIGHTVGLGHDGHDSDYLMNDVPGDGAKWLLSADAYAYLLASVSVF